jgi:hypothetical protein
VLVGHPAQALLLLLLLLLPCRYADLCADLGKELPSFPPAEGDTKPITFRRVLLNTCQDEFEAAEDARRVSVCVRLCVCVYVWEGGGNTCDNG